MNYTKYKLLRQIVLLGMEHNSWVKQKTLTGNTEDFLTYVFPRTYKKATFQLAFEIATKEHDDNIRGNMIHLFRFPHSDEQELNNENYMHENYDVILKLEELAEGVAIETGPGPINIGSVAELDEQIILKSFARHYVDAFKHNYKTYPYLT